MKKLKTYLGLLLIIGLGLFILGTMQVSAQPLTKDSSTGNVTEVDISIDPAEPLPANGTVTISTEGATDTDMNAFPPEGVYVVISSDTVTVTNQTVDIGTAEEEEEEDETESEGGPGNGGPGNGGPGNGGPGNGGPGNGGPGDQE
jgi:hypothetical protein